MATLTLTCRLDALLRERGLNQSQLARELGINTTTVHHWLHGRRRPHVDDALLVARHLGVKVDDIWKFERAA